MGVQIKMRKKTTIIQPKYCNIDLGEISVSNDAEFHALSHLVISVFSRRNFLSANLEGKASPGVRRSLYKKLGCIPKVIKKRRRILEIFKHEREQEVETESDGGFSLSDETF